MLVGAKKGANLRYVDPPEERGFVRGVGMAVKVKATDIGMDTIDAFNGPQGHGGAAVGGGSDKVGRSTQSLFQFIAEIRMVPNGR